MKVIKLTESELSHIIRRVIRTEQDSENENSETPKMDTLVALKKFIRGDVSKDDLYNVDDTIYHIETKQPLGQSIITVKFDSEKEFLDLIDIDEQDSWFMSALNSYDGYQFMDSYQIEQDFKDGYNVYYELNDENNETLKSIAQTILPEKEFNIQDEEYKSELSNTLLELFPTEMDYILGDYQSEKDYEMNTVAKETIKKEFNDPLDEIGVKLNYDMDEVEVVIGDLYMNALQSNMYGSNTKEMVIKLIQNGIGDSPGGWYENSYEFQDDNYFDIKSFNNEVERQFEKIIEKLEEQSDEFYTIKDYVEFKNRITSKYKLKTWYQSPKDENIKFMINSLEWPSMTIKMMVNDSRSPYGKNIDLDEEGFNNFLYQYSLDGLENNK